MISNYGETRGITFSNAFENVNKFVEYYKESGFEMLMSEDSLKTTFNLLYAYYGNSTYASSDINRAKMKTMSYIFQYCPFWEKKLSLQKEIRKLTLEDATKGSKLITSSGDTPSVKTNPENEIDYLDKQQITLNVRSKTDAYERLSFLLEEDITKEYMNRFKDLFVKMVDNEDLLFYNN